MAPHGKTTMSPQLFARQLEAGCWAMTVGTVHQLRVCRSFGLKRIVLANQLVGRAEIDYVFSENISNTDYERVMREYAEAGHKLIVGEVFGVEQAARDVARDYPDVEVRWVPYLLDPSIPPEGRTRKNKASDKQIVRRRKTGKRR